MLEDYDLIVSSFQAQYGLRLSKELRNMPWVEFCQLLSGLGPETPLGRIVSIRAENDKEMLKHFTKEQHRIRNQWRSRAVSKVSQDDLASFLEQTKQAFLAMAGGGK